jgi:DNA segregation ATPase FtsK/SpoIIIE, S-DNA-T family
MTAALARPSGFPCSMFDPVHVGIDETGLPVFLDLDDRPGILIGGEPGAGKSSIINLITAHGALSRDCRLILVDGKLVELGPWRGCADTFVGPSITDAIGVFEQVQAEMNSRYARLLDTGRRKISRDDGEPAYLIVIDEYSYFSATVGTKAEREKFATTTRDIGARGRAAAVRLVLATQRPDYRIIEPSLRDLFGYRWALRCSTAASSDTVLGQGQAALGFNAATINPLARGVGWLLSDLGTPRRVKAAYLKDADVTRIASYAASLRGRP